MYIRWFLSFNLHYRNLALCRTTRKTRFDPRRVYVVFVVDKVALGQVFYDYFGLQFGVSFNKYFILIPSYTYVSQTL